MMKKYIIGIDEVGRGPIAGPVAVCAFCTTLDFLDHISTGESATSPTGGWKLPKLRDSKKLSRKQRGIWFEFLKKQKEDGVCDFAVSFVSSENIDKFGISKCIQKALDEALHKVTQPEILFEMSSDEGGEGARPFRKESLASFRIFLDGGLKAPKEYIHQETIIKGDELHPIISCASIIAKVSRDKVMEGFSKKYPEYGFDHHAGYGTRAHYEAIKKHGQTSIHRKSFIH